MEYFLKYPILAKPIYNLLDNKSFSNKLQNYERVYRILPNEILWTFINEFSKVCSHEKKLIRIVQKGWVLIQQDTISETVEYR